MVASMDERHRFIAVALTEALALDDISMAERVVGSEVALPAVNDFLAGAEEAGKLLFFYQPRDVQNEAGEFEAGSGPPVLFLTSGESEKLRGKCVYFARTTAPGKAVHAARVHSEIVVGRIAGSALDSFETVMSEVFVPVLESKEDWGKNSSESTKDFLSGVTKFSDGLSEMLNSLQGGIELTRPDRAFDVENKQPAFNRAAQDVDYVKHYEEVMEEWCEKTERLLNETEQNRKEPEDVGPNSELEFWRARVHKFNSVMEQLKTRDCKVVLGVLTAAKSPMVKRWKTIDTYITDAANEAKDNVRYLAALEKFTEPLYTGTPAQVIESLPALLNNVKMMYSMAKFYNTSDRMTTLFSKITNQMITNCKNAINGPGKIWTQTPAPLIETLKTCVRLSEAYWDQYKMTKDKLLVQPKGKQFDFSEAAIFGKFDAFCKRIAKLIDVFETIEQFATLAEHKIEGMDVLIDGFFEIVAELKKKPYDFLDHLKTQFDKDYVGFNKAVESLESSLQTFINRSFDNISSTEQALALLRQFQAILQRDNLKVDLDSKYMQIFQNYGMELEEVQRIYEKQKQHPPILRNAPPVTGNVAWARQLLRRIEDPMRNFQANKSVMGTREAKKIIRTYNKVARALIEFETLWQYAWAKSIESARAGLQATLLIRHPENRHLYVNFDREILQLIRESKFMQRMGIEVPETARNVMLQEEKFKYYHQELTFALAEYERVTYGIVPVVANLMQPHIDDIEAKLMPGMTTLTWTSMNIDGYLHRIHTALRSLEDLASKANDLVQNRIDSTLKSISNTKFIELEEDHVYTLDEFIGQHEKHVKTIALRMDAKNYEVELAVNDLIQLIQSFPLDVQPDAIKQEAAIQRLRTYYSRIMLRALLKATKNSLAFIKARVNERDGVQPKPLFDVDVELAIPDVTMNPSLDDIQAALSRTAVAVVHATKVIYTWGQDRNSSQPLRTYFELVAKDKGIMRDVILLTGGVERVRRSVADFLGTYLRYDYLWKDDMGLAFGNFLAQKPSLDDFEAQMDKYLAIENEVLAIENRHTIGALSLQTESLKYSLKAEAAAWKAQFSKSLHRRAKTNLDHIAQFMEELDKRLDAEVTNIDELRVMLGTLREIRDREAELDEDFVPVEDEYALLIKFGVRVPKEETAVVGELRHQWKRVSARADAVSEKLSVVQMDFKRDLIRDVKAFTVDVIQFRNDFDANGPTVQGLAPAAAVERLRKFRRLFDEREDKAQAFTAGEQLFGLPVTEYPDLDKTRSELKLVGRLYDLYTEVLATIDGWKTSLWADVQFSAIQTRLEEFQARSRKLPKALREWEAYRECRETIDEFSRALPILQQLGQRAMRNRHWAQVMQITGQSFRLDPDVFRMEDVFEAGLMDHVDEIGEVTTAAGKELEIEMRIRQVEEDWNDQTFTFAEFRNRGQITLKGNATQAILDCIDDSQASLAGMKTSRFVAPFKAEITQWLSKFSTVSDVVELWLEVQATWVHLESVFTSKDIMMKLPREAKRFAQVDKNWVKVMGKAGENPNVISLCCGSDFVQNMLPHLKDQLEICQKALAGHLEAKRNAFPRFAFVSDTVLLDILSQTQDPGSIQTHLTSLFTNIGQLAFDVLGAKRDTIQISSMTSQEGEKIPLSRPVQVDGNIEDWLLRLECEMQDTVRIAAREAAADSTTLGMLELVDKYPSQIALLGIQFLWTAESTDALTRSKSEKSAMGAQSKKLATALGQLVQAAQADLDPLQRVKMETIITTQVHQRDVFEQLVQQKVTSPLDFEWLRQARFTWNPDTATEGGDCIVSVGPDVDITYSYEYLGALDRLVITPLTDRCYIAMTQALNMMLGGSPIGPAGTGKTETIKDLARSIGRYIVVINCSDQMDFRGMGKIFKGLAQSGAWGCFDEFNRLVVDVLSVAAAQLNCIFAGMREKKQQVLFTDGSTVALKNMGNTGLGVFITMNPGYAGRQELPENLKTLFRGVTMMVPDKEIIIKVKLASQGFQNSAPLAKKFTTLYSISEHQLSKAVHYDWGLRNVLSVLRTTGPARRAAPEGTPDVQVLVQALNAINVPKLVASDVPIFQDLVATVFPDVDVAEEHSEELVAAIREEVDAQGLVFHEPWIAKVMQLHQTASSRHGIMLVGPSASGKSACAKVLLGARTRLGDAHVIKRINPKAVNNTQLFGAVDVKTDDWTEGILSSIWRKAMKAKASTWLVLDGPVDAVWIENLNSVLDDNRTITLANGDRLPLTSSMKLVFETENLNNASPATVSRAGMVYLSETVLGWRPIVDAWLSSRSKEQAAAIESVLQSHMGNLDRLFRWVMKHATPLSRLEMANYARTFLDLLESLVEEALGAYDTLVVELPEAEIKRMNAAAESAAAVGTAAPSSAPATKATTTPRGKGKGKRGKKGDAKKGESQAEAEAAAAAAAATAAAEAAAAAMPRVDAATRAFLERMIYFAAIWSVGGLLVDEDAVAFDTFIRTVSNKMPGEANNPDATVYDYYLDVATGDWAPWDDRLTSWSLQSGLSDHSQLCVPTSGNLRLTYLVEMLARRDRPVLLLGEEGSGKTAVVRQFCSGLSDEDYVVKNLNFSYATTPIMFQRKLEGSVEKIQGRTYGPSGGRKMILFIDDISLPKTNEWGDQATNELVRQLLGDDGFYNVDKPGDWTSIADTLLIGAMQIPRGGANDVPARLKGHFGLIKVPMPDRTSLDTMFGLMLKGHFEGTAFETATPKLTAMTVSLWSTAKEHMLPIVSKFHYSFTVRELSRVTTGMMQCDPSTLQSEGDLLALWQHETQRAMEDKLSTAEDKDWFRRELTSVMGKFFPGAKIASDTPLFADFLREASPDDGTDATDADEPEDPKVYELVRNEDVLHTRLLHFIEQYNQYNPSMQMNIVLFDDWVNHLLRIARIIRVPGNHALLLGVVGSGRQTMTRLASFIAGRETFQIAIHNSYDVPQFLEDLRVVFKRATVGNRKISFLMTDAEVKNDAFLEYISSYLMTGEVGTLFPREDLDAMLSELVIDAKAAEPDFVDTRENLYKFFLARLRNNLSFLLSFSHAGDSFRHRARRFPGLLSGCTVDWFLPWDQSALITVGSKSMQEFVINSKARQAVLRAQVRNEAEAAAAAAAAAAEAKKQKKRPTASKDAGGDDAHDDAASMGGAGDGDAASVGDGGAGDDAASAKSGAGDDRKSVAGSAVGGASAAGGDDSASTKSGAVPDAVPALALLEEDADSLASKGRLVEFMADVHSTVGEAADKYLARFDRHVYVTPRVFTNYVDSFKAMYDEKHDAISRMASNVDVGLAKLKKAGEDVNTLNEELKVKQVSLDAAQVEYDEMLATITAGTVKAEKKKSEVLAVKNELAANAEFIAKEKAEAEQDLAAAKPALDEAEDALTKIKSSDIASLKSMANPPDLIRRIFDCVLLLKYNDLEPVEMVETAKKRTIKTSYPHAQKMMADSKFINSLKNFEKDQVNAETVELLQPYISAPDFNPATARKASGNVGGLAAWVIAMCVYYDVSKAVRPKIDALREAELRLEGANAQLGTAEAELKVHQDEVDRMQKEFDVAQARKQEILDDAERTRDRIEKANSLLSALDGERTRWTQQSEEFDSTLSRLYGDVAVATAFTTYCGAFNQEARTELLTEIREACERHSVATTPDLDLTSFLADEARIGQLTIEGLPPDPLSLQNGLIVTSSQQFSMLVDPQGQGCNWIKNRERDNGLVITSFGRPDFRAVLEDCLMMGRPLLVENVEESVDPVLDPVLDRRVAMIGRSLKLIMADGPVDFNDNFQLYLTTKLSNPHFSPEVSSRVLIVDFTVTHEGLESQLLTRVILKEKAMLEEQRQKVMEEIQVGTAKVLDLEKQLLDHLSASQGDLLEDTALVALLSETKTTAREVKSTLEAAAVTRAKLNEAREEYRAVATRGAVLYKVGSDMARVNHMYALSMDTFLDLFDGSVNSAARAPMQSKRIANIIGNLTWTVFSYANVGYFENDQSLFALLLALRVELSARRISNAAFSFLLQGGAALDPSSVPQKPVSLGWLGETEYLNVLQLVSAVPEQFDGLVSHLSKSDADWQAWVDDETPETAAAPSPIGDSLTPFTRLLLVRALRQDRVLLCASTFIQSVLGERFVAKPVVDIHAIATELNCRTPLILLLSPGSDPSSGIRKAAAKHGKEIDWLSLGQGQSDRAWRAIANAVANGRYVVVQNAHFSLGALPKLGQFLSTVEEIDDSFRLFITTEQHAQFPLSLLTMSRCVSTAEASGVSVRMSAAYNSFSGDLVDAVPKTEYRVLLFTLTFLHAIVQERRKFGPIGWAVAYEFNSSDLSAGVQFLKSHLYSSQTVSWSALRYIIGEVQYGGKVFDDMDRRLFAAYMEQLFSPAVLGNSFQLAPGYTPSSSSDIFKLRNLVQDLPKVDAPEIFGLDPNADVSSRSADVQKVLSTVVSLQPSMRASASSGMDTKAVQSLIADLLSRVPKAIARETVEARLEKLGGARLALNLFLVAEINKLNSVVASVSRTLDNLKKALAGVLAMNGQLDEALSAISVAAVPKRWLKAANDDVATSPPLGGWLATLTQRAEQLQSWLTGRPPVLWLPGFFNPRGFFLAVMQQECQAKALALDAVQLNTTVMAFDKSEMKKDAPTEGVLVHGLVLEGGAWDKSKGRLVDSEPKQLFASLPVVHLTVAETKGAHSPADDNMYQCPIYTSPRRTMDRYIGTLTLKVDDTPRKYILRGVAALTSTEKYS